MHMFLVEVIPFARLPRILPDTFSYFSAVALPAGAVVEIEVKQRKLMGMVLSSEAVRNSKQELRTASFMLKKIARVVSETPLLNERDWEFLRWFSGHYLTSPASVLRLMIPAFTLKGNSVSDWGVRQNHPALAVSDPKLIIRSELLGSYQTEVEKAFAKGRQVLVIAPDIASRETLREALGRKIPTQSLMLVESGSRVSELRKFWHLVRSGAPAVVIGSRLPLFLPFSDLGLIILDDDGSPAHKSWDQHPRYHAREIAEKLHDLHGGLFIIGGYPPSLASYHRVKYETLSADVEIIPDQNQPPVSLFVEMEKDIKEAGSFVVISQVLKDKLRSVIHEGGRAFLFVNRRGFAPFILCQDCGESLRCNSCSVPLVYHIQESLREPTLLCHYCSAKNQAPERCSSCDSHRLKPYGIGVERVLKDIRKIFPGVATVAVSVDTVKKPSDAKRISSRLSQSSPYIAVGTERALFGLNLPACELTAIISVDTALFLPDYLQNERLYRVLTLIRSHATKHFIFQSFSKEPELLRDLFHGTFEHFAEKELKDRRRFGYPPFGELIKLTVSNTSRETALRDIKELYKSLVFASTRAPAEAIEITNPYPAYVEKQKGGYIFHVLIKILDRKNSSMIKEIINPYIGSNVGIDVGPATLL